MQEEEISMTLGRPKYIHLVLMLGLSPLIPVFLAYSLYVDLSGAVLLSSDMTFEKSDDEDLSICQTKFKVFGSAVSSNPLLPWTCFGEESCLFLPPLTSDSQITLVLRC